MKSKSAWSRGLLYGSIFGGPLGVLPATMALFAGAPLDELALGGGASILIWGGLGFLAGYASYSEPASDLPGNAVAKTDVSLFRRLLYRFVAGLLLSYITAMIVYGIGFLVFFAFVQWHGGFDAPPPRTSPEEMRMVFIAIVGVLGASVGTITACWLGALLTPGGNQLGPIAKRAMISAILGLLAGGWLGGMIGGLQLFADAERERIAILAALAGAVAGIAAAIFVHRRGLR